MMSRNELQYFEASKMGPYRLIVKFSIMKCFISEIRGGRLLSI